ncbi:hypothetical protein OUZ56_000482 [Daphnia magna]|uniref:Uncharacterized protein n=1 Tax=Daphnia magna TaxID=35525 RepID=A0ABQ9ZZU1_9CRUS|nr:hypothetical protein OUZ56_000482 [Daphnia magna]
MSATLRNKKWRFDSPAMRSASIQAIEEFPIVRPISEDFLARQKESERLLAVVLSVVSTRPHCQKWNDRTENAVAFIYGPRPLVGVQPLGDQCSLRPLLSSDSDALLLERITVFSIGRRRRIKITATNSLFGPAKFRCNSAGWLRTRTHAQIRHWGLMRKQILPLARNNNSLRHLMISSMAKLWNYKGSQKNEEDHYNLSPSYAITKSQCDA